MTIAAWLRRHFRYAALSDASLRTLRATYEACGVFPKEREAIAVELAMRSWADFLAARLDRPACVWTERGGRS